MNLYWLIYMLFFWPFGFSIIGLFVRFAIVGIVVTDCRLKGKYAFWWGVLTFFLGIWGVILYMIFGSDVLKNSAKRMARSRVINEITKSDELRTKIPSRTSGLARAPFDIPDAQDEYVDHYIEELLAEGKIKEARTKVDQTIALAEELGDSVTAEKYAGYKARLSDSVYDDEEGEVPDKSEWFTSSNHYDASS